MKTKDNAVNFRNPVATSDLLKKSGVHLSETKHSRNKQCRSKAKKDLKTKNLEVYCF